MQVIETEPGEMLYAAIRRAQAVLQADTHSCLTFRHNDTEILIYRESYIGDLCDKFDLTRSLWQLRNPPCHGGY